MKQLIKTSYFFFLLFTNPLAAASNNSLGNKNDNYLITKMDEELSLYYEKMNWDDYFNNGVGKFKLYCMKMDYGDEDVRVELEDKDYDNSLLVEFDEKFSSKNPSHIANNIKIFDKLYDLAFPDHLLNPNLKNEILKSIVTEVPSTQKKSTEHD